MGLDGCGIGGDGAALRGVRAARWRSLHPVDFSVSMGWVMDVIWFSVFLAWTAKMIVLKFGGPGLYARSGPLFLGLAPGQIVAGGLWLVVDYLTGMVGNQIPMLY